MHGFDLGIILKRSVPKFTSNSRFYNPYKKNQSANLEPLKKIKSWRTFVSPKRNIVM